MEAGIDILLEFIENYHATDDGRVHPEQHRAESGRARQGNGAPSIDLRRILLHCFVVHNLGKDAVADRHRSIADGHGD